MKRLACSLLPLLSIASVVALALPLQSGTAFGASLSVTSAQVQETGDTARVCVGLSAGAGEVAATQNDLVWDDNCASLVDKCEANPAHGKQLMSNQRGQGELRAIIISLQDTNTIPDGELYCCTFRAALTSGGSCCAIGLQGMSASDSEGRALGLAGRGGQICLASSAGSSGGLEGGTGRQQQEPVSADLGSGAQQPPAPAAGQPAGQEAAPKAAGSGTTVAGGGAGGVPGGVGGVPGGIGGVPGGQPGVPIQPGQVAQQAPGSEPAEGSQPAPAQAPAAGAPQPPVAAPEGTPTVAPAAAARPTTAPAAAAREAAPASKPPAAAAPKATVKAVAPAPAPQGSGCSCEIAPSGLGFEGSGALIAVGLLLWARRRRI